MTNEIIEETKKAKERPYKNPVCRGSVKLGNNCGICERCLEDIKETKKETKDEVESFEEWLRRMGLGGADQSNFLGVWGQLQQKDERIKELERDRDEALETVSDLQDDVLKLEIRDKKLMECVKFYSNTKNIEVTGLNLAGKGADVDLSELGVVARQCLKNLRDG